MKTFQNFEDVKRFILDLKSDEIQDIFYKKSIWLVISHDIIENTFYYSINISNCNELKFGYKTLRKCQNVLIKRIKEL